MRSRVKVRLRPLAPIGGNMEKAGKYLLCPKCGKKTKVKTIPGTELKRFPLYCTWCKTETIIDHRA